MSKSKTITVMAVSLSFIICSLFLVSNLLSAEPEQQQQQPLITIGSEKIDLIYELKKAEIIPTVIDAFHPLLAISITWKNATAKYGNTIDPALTQDTPTIEFLDDLPSSSWSTNSKTPQLTLAMSDPDAPSRDNPEWSEFCHWIVTSVPLTSSEDNDSESDNVYESESSDLSEIMPYKPPGPPPQTGKHRYVFVALSPLNGTTEQLYLSQPGERRRWGFEHEREGLRKWASEMGLGVVGANFIYAQNEEQ